MDASLAAARTTRRVPSTARPGATPPTTSPCLTGRMSQALCRALASNPAAAATMAAAAAAAAAATAAVAAAAAAEAEAKAAAAAAAVAAAKGTVDIHSSSCGRWWSLLKAVSASGALMATDGFPHCMLSPDCAPHQVGLARWHPQRCLPTA